MCSPDFLLKLRMFSLGVGVWRTVMLMVSAPIMETRGGLALLRTWIGSFASNDSVM